jgi:hypothetical protein
MRRLELGVLVLVEAEDDLRPLIMNRPPDRVGFSSIIAIASFFDFGSGRSLNTGLRC